MYINTEIRKYIDPSGGTMQVVDGLDKNIMLTKQEPLPIKQKTKDKNFARLKAITDQIKENERKVSWVYD